MFTSASECTPETPVSLEFVSSKDQVLDISIDVTISINGIVTSDRPITVLTGQTVTATVTTPPGYLQYQFYEYFLDGQKNHFAVVNKNFYAPTVKIPDRAKRWFNYNVTDLRISFHDFTDIIDYPIGFAKNIVDIQSAHVVLDHINNAVGFYSPNRTMITKVLLPAGPIEYKKHTYQIPSTGIETFELIVLCNNKRVYRIRFDNRYFDSGEFTPTVIPLINLGNLWFDQDMPTGETFIEFRRQRFLGKLSPILTALDIGNDYIWLAGYDSVFVLNKTSFAVLHQISLPFETIISICSINNDAIVTTRTGKVIYVSYSGQYTTLYTSLVVGAPSAINNYTAVAVPDPDNKRILVFEDDSGNYTEWPTEDYVPAYAREFDGKLWVTGHDTNTVLCFETSTEIKQYEFEHKVTVVSVVGTSILGVHYLQNITTLNLDGVEKVIPFTLQSKKGPISHIGSDPVAVAMLGQEGILAKTSPGLTCWVNGITNEIIQTNDNVGVSYRGESVGNFRSVLILGDTAIDFDVEVAAAAEGFVSRNFKPKYIKSNEDFSSKVQFVIDQNIGLQSNVLISASYGYLSVNNSSYYGERYITEGSLITLKIPFNQSQRAIAPILSIDTHQIAIPIKSGVNSQADLDLVLPSTITSYTDLTANTIQTGNLIIPISDTYYIPEYYSMDNDIVFTLVREDSETVLTKGMMYDFMSGDQIFVSNIVTSTSIYDTRQVIVIGSLLTGLTWQTTGPGLIDTITFDTLVEPFHSNNEYVFADGIVYDDGYTSYQSNTGLITSGNIFTCNLYVDTSNSGMVIDGNPIVGYYATNVPMQSNIALTRFVSDFFQEPITLYQVYYDSDLNSNVYVQVGVWDIINKFGVGSELDAPPLTVEDSFLEPAPDLYTVLSTPMDPILDLNTIIMQSRTSVESLISNFLSILKTVMSPVGLSNRGTYAPLSLKIYPELVTRYLATKFSTLSINKPSLTNAKIDYSQTTDQYRTIINGLLNFDRKPVTNRTTLTYNLAFDKKPDGNIKTLTYSKIKFNDKTDGAANVLSGRIYFDSTPDTFKKTLGVDRIYFDKKSDTFSKSLGIDRIYFDTKPDTYKKTLGIDRIYFDTTPDTYKKTLGVDRIYFDTTPDTFKKTLEFDRIYFDTTPDTFKKTLGVDRIYFDTTPDTFKKTLGVDRIYFDTTPDTYKKTVEFDRIYFDTTPDTYKKTVEFDRIYFDTTPDTYKKTLGIDRIYFDTTPDTYKKTLGIDRIYFDANPDTYKKTLGVDRIDFDTIPDTFKKTLNIDRIYFDTTPDTFKKTLGIDRFYFDRTPDTYKKTLGIDRFYFDRTPDTYKKTLGVDRIYFDTTPDTYKKTLGVDRFYFDRTPDTYKKTLGVNRFYFDTTPDTFKKTLGVNRFYFDAKPDTYKKTLGVNRFYFDAKPDTYKKTLGVNRFYFDAKPDTYKKTVGIDRIYFDRTPADYKLTLTTSSARSSVINPFSLTFTKQQNDLIPDTQYKTLAITPMDYDWFVNPTLILDIMDYDAESNPTLKLVKQSIDKITEPSSVAILQEYNLENKETVVTSGLTADWFNDTNLSYKFEFDYDTKTLVAVNGSIGEWYNNNYLTHKLNATHDDNYFVTSRALGTIIDRFTILGEKNKIGLDRGTFISLYFESITDINNLISSKINYTHDISNYLNYKIGSSVDINNLINSKITYTHDISNYINYKLDSSVDINNLVISKFGATIDISNYINYRLGSTIDINNLVISKFGSTIDISNYINYRLGSSVDINNLVISKINPTSDISNYVSYKLGSTVDINNLVVSKIDPTNDILNYLTHILKANVDTNNLVISRIEPDHDISNLLTYRIDSAIDINNLVVSKINADLDKTNLLTYKIEPIFNLSISELVNRFNVIDDKSNQLLTKLRGPIIDSNITYLLESIGVKLDVSNSLSTRLTNLLQTDISVLIGKISESLSTVTVLENRISETLDTGYQVLTGKLKNDLFTGSVFEIGLTGRLDDDITLLSPARIDPLLWSETSISIDIEPLLDDKITMFSRRLDVVYQLNNLLEIELKSNLLVNPIYVAAKFGIILDEVTEIMTLMAGPDIGNNSTFAARISELLDSTSTITDNPLTRILDVVTQLNQTLTHIIDVVTQLNRPLVQSLDNAHQLTVGPMTNIIDNVSQLAQPLTHIEDIPTQIFEELQRQLDNTESHLHLPLQNIEDVVTQINQPLEPLEDIPSQLYQPLEHVIDAPTRIIKLLEVEDVRNVATEIAYPLNFTFDNDILWVSDKLNETGAYKTLIQIYADNGRGGDKITNMGTPPSNLPFVLYSKEYNYNYGSYNTFEEALEVSNKYASATPIPIVGTNYWNYRIYFGKKHYSVPKKGLVFPVKWLTRGG